MRKLFAASRRPESLIAGVVVWNVALVAASLWFDDPSDLWEEVCLISSSVSQTALYASLAMTMRLGPQLAWPLAAIAGLTGGYVLLFGVEVAIALLALATGSAAWLLPTRLSGKRLVRVTESEHALVYGQTHSLKQWFTTIAVIAAWFVLARLFPGNVSDQSIFVATSIAGSWGTLAMLQIRSSGLAWLLLVSVVLLCGFAWIMISGEALATMNWTATNVHGDLAPLSSPIEFVTTRLDHLKYFNMLEAGVVWLTTLLALEIAILGWLRWAGFRIVGIDISRAQTFD